MDDRRVAIVTGGASAIGRAIASSLVSAGFDCVIAGRSLDTLERASREIQAGVGAVLACVADITEPDDREKLVARCLKRLGRIDALINNAAATITKPLWSYEPSDWREVMATNLEAAFFLSQRCSMEMPRGSSGRIVNIGSVYGRLALNADFYRSRLPKDAEAGPVREYAYPSSKGGLLQMTRELAVALAPLAITVNAVSPGMIDAVPERLPNDVRTALTGMTPLGRLGSPQDIGSAVAFLASREAGFITGTELAVDGGWSAW